MGLPRKELHPPRPEAVAALPESSQGATTVHEKLGGLPATAPSQGDVGGVITMPQSPVTLSSRAHQRELNLPMENDGLSSKEAPRGIEYGACISWLVLHRQRWPYKEPVTYPIC